MASFETKFQFSVEPSNIQNLATFTLASLAEADLVNDWTIIVS